MTNFLFYFIHMYYFKFDNLYHIGKVMALNGFWYMGYADAGIAFMWCSTRKNIFWLVMYYTKTR
jgi:hypothetical protein